MPERGTGSWHDEKAVVGSAQHATASTYESSDGCRGRVPQELSDRLAAQLAEWLAITALRHRAEGERPISQARHEHGATVSDERRHPPLGWRALELPRPSGGGDRDSDWQ